MNSTFSTVLEHVDTSTLPPSISTLNFTPFLNPFLSMNEYIGMRTLTFVPVFARAKDRAPITSASPPDFEKGTVSLDTIKTFIDIIRNHAYSTVKKCFLNSV